MCWYWPLPGRIRETEWSTFRDGDDDDAAAEDAVSRPPEAVEVQVDDDGDDRRRDEGGEGGVEAGAGAVGIPAQGGQERPAGDKGSAVIVKCEGMRS